jgi:hypothetical protein
MHRSSKVKLKTACERVESRLGTFVTPRCPEETLAGSALLVQTSGGGDDGAMP